MNAPESLKQLRKDTTEEVRKFVYETMFDVEERLLLALPQMAKAVLESGKQATYSPTVTFKKGKRDTLKVVVSARVRLPDEAKEFVFRLGAQGQLELAIATEPEVVDPEFVFDEEPETVLDPDGDAPPFTPNREPEPGLERETAPNFLTPAQERLKAIRDSNLALARAGKLTPQQMEAAKITPEDLAANG